MQGRPEDSAIFDRLRSSCEDRLVREEWSCRARTQIPSLDSGVSSMYQFIAISNGESIVLCYYYIRLS